MANFFGDSDVVAPWVEWFYKLNASLVIQCSRVLTDNSHNTRKQEKENFSILPCSQLFE